jgi:hypothetical protein
MTGKIVDEGRLSRGDCPKILPIGVLGDFRLKEA